MDGESETESPPKSAQKSESRPARKRTLGSKSAFLNAQKGAKTSGFAQKSAPMRSFTQKRAHVCAYMRSFTQKSAQERSHSKKERGLN